MCQKKHRQQAFEKISREALDEMAGLAEICARWKGAYLNNRGLAPSGRVALQYDWLREDRSARSGGGLDKQKSRRWTWTLELRQKVLCKLKWSLGALRGKMDNLRRMRVGVLGLGLREYLQQVCVGILPEDRLLESRPVGSTRSLVEVLPM